ncbi:MULTISPECIES: hypothetical protein [unclassified Peribacillus]|uniref:hypothetical protein n=1 Tax=unclassified Peribacillus TaxID=2675266 RepID=UPI001F4E2B04|nr:MULTISPECIES: hypothetical protein [unclassified Peribacillus]MCK1986012.1 hypothetical protein [Peribacillus sp. Aquil_B1]MCK2011235.1 hypothetical protein [Peribacillus sp. Aquil_B8]
MIKERHPQLFEIKGNYIEAFPVDKEKSVFFILKDKDAYFGVYKQESKEAHIVTPVFPTKEALLQKTLGTSHFEKFRMHSFFIEDDGKAFSLHDNKQLRLNLAKSYKILTTYENIEQARTFVVKEELKNDPKLRKQSLRRALEEHFIPSDLLGKTVTIQNISNNGQGTRLSLEPSNSEGMNSYYNDSIKNKEAELLKTRDPATRIRLQSELESAKFQLNQVLSNRSTFMYLYTYIFIQATSLEELKTFEDDVQRILTKLRMKALNPHYATPMA